MTSAMDELLSLSLEEVPSCDDKLGECQYFLSLAASTDNIEHFRWLMSAFLSAAKSYIDIRIRRIYISTLGESDNYQFSSLAFSDFKDYFDTKIDKRGRIHIRSTHEIIGPLIKLRNSNTHHNPLIIKNHQAKTVNPDLRMIPQISTKSSILIFMQSTFDVLQELNELE